MIGRKGIMENTIFDDNTENTIGFYKDLAKGYKELIKEATDKGDYEEASDLIEQAQEIDDYKEFDGLLVLSMNNGMGFTCSPYKQEERA